MSDPEALKKGAIVSAAYDTLLQVGLRITSFILNAFIVRHVSQEVFAVMSVRLHLLYSTGLLLSREAFRRAALSSKGSREIHKVINLVWIGTLVSGPVCVLGWYVWSYMMERPPEAVTTNYNAGVMFMVFSIVVEVAAEVPFVLAELQLWNKTKVVIEGLMQLLRSLLLAAFVYAWPMQSVFMYGVSHILGSLVYCASYYGLFIRVFHSKEDIVKLPVQGTRQLFPKWKQGELLVVNNLGSLAARLVFRSIETASYKYFAQMVYRGKPVKEQDQDRVAEVVRFLSSLIHNLMLISIIILTFGWSYSSMVLQFYGGRQLRDGGGTQLMRAQCFYIVFLAINGITESYTFAAMDDIQLSRCNRLMVFFSFAYIGTAVMFTKILGAVGFVVANCINMGLRITYSLWLIRNQYKSTEYHPLKSLHIHPKFIAAFVSAMVLTAFSEVFVYPRSIISHLGVGALCLIAVMYFLRWELKSIVEKILQFISKLLSRFASQDKQSDQGQFSKVLVVDKIHKFLYRP